jgi:hypothetical protein
MLAHPQRLLRLDTTLGTLLRRSLRFDFDEVRSLAVALVFEEVDERSPRRRRSVPTVRRQLHHPVNIEVFDRHEIVLPSVVVARCAAP